MNAYLLSDLVRINGATGLILETGEAPGKNSVLGLIAPRGGFSSFQVIIEDADKQTLSVKAKADHTDIGIELFEEWFHETEDQLTPDCLIPVNEDGTLKAKQALSKNLTCIWVDIYVPETLDAGKKDITVFVESEGNTRTLSVTVDISETVLPETGLITCDLNNYADAISPQFPSMRSNPERYRDGSYIALEHEYYLMAREHRSLFHNLPYRHSGKIKESFAPVISGEGKDIHVSDWSLFDRHFGPLLDGSAFENSRVSKKPVEYMYLPFHLGWPASYEKWGKKGYKTEYRRILNDFVRHFEEKGWTKTKLELFLNHKKDYRFFPYTADEIWYLHDEEVMDKWHDVIKGAYEDTTVPIIVRIDSSNYFGVHHNNHRFAEYCKLWVAGESMFNWYPESVDAFRKYGNTLWIYGSVLHDMRTSLLSLYQWPIVCMMTGADGFCVWNTTGAGKDPLKTPVGNGTELLFYPGEAFSLTKPLASIRLKTLRNAMQAAEAAKVMNQTDVHNFVNKLFDKNGDADWWREKPDFIDTPPRYWDFGEAFSKAIVPPLFAGKSPLLAADFRSGIYSGLKVNDNPGSYSGFRYY